MVQHVAFVTGAGSGIGREIARLLASRSLKIIVADINMAGAEETVSIIKENNGEAAAVYCDVTNLESVKSAVQDSLNYYQQIDVLVNNAGWDKVEPFLKSEPDTWKRIIDINLMGQIHTCKAILPLMIESGYGKVVNIASDAARVDPVGKRSIQLPKAGWSH